MDFDRSQTKNEFIGVIRIVDRDGYWVTFTKAQFNQFMRLVIDLPEMNDYHIEFEANVEANAEENDSIFIEKTFFNDEIYEIKRGIDIEKRQRLLIGFTSLERIVRLYELINYVFDNLDVKILKKTFLKIIMEGKARISFVSEIDKKESIRIFLMEYIVENYEFDENSIEYQVARDTQANFEDYFKYILESQ